MIPNWLAKNLNLEAKQKIHDAIVKAEKKTSGEIVPMIVMKSSVISHIKVILFFAFLTLVVATKLIEHQMLWLYGIWLWAFIDGVLIFILSQWLSQSFFIQRILTAKIDLIKQVNNRSEIEFFEAGFGKTRDSTGILLFVSIMEKRAVVLADSGISQKLPQETWTEIVKIMTESIKSRDMAGGFIKAIEKCSDILAKHFPPRSDDTNELEDRVIIKQ